MWGSSKWWKRPNAVGDSKLATACGIIAEAMARRAELKRTPWVKISDPIAVSELESLSRLLTTVTETARSEDYELYKVLIEAGNALGTRLMRARRKTLRRCCAESVN
jgi:hypothetical protein